MIVLILREYMKENTLIIIHFKNPCMGGTYVFNLFNIRAKIFINCFCAFVNLKNLPFDRFFRPERAGFEPAVPCGHTVFPGLHLKPLGHLSNIKFFITISYQKLFFLLYPLPFFINCHI